MIRRNWPVVTAALLSTSVLFLQTLFSGKNSLVRVPLVFVVILVLIGIVDFVQHRFVPPTMAILRPILNSCARIASEITTVSGFLTESDEESLVHGDEVHVLTNSLKGYDMTPPAVKVIADNLRDGVRYLYYLPQGEDYPTLATEKESFVAKIASQSDLLGGVMEQELRFFLVKDPCIFNFAVVVHARSGQVAGYWYVTTPAAVRAPSIQTPLMGSAEMGRSKQLAPDVPKQLNHVSNPSLVILKLDRDQTDRVWRLFGRLRRSSTRVSAMSPGLQPMRRSPWRSYG